LILSPDRCPFALTDATSLTVSGNVSVSAGSASDRFGLKLTTRRSGSNLSIDGVLAGVCYRAGCRIRLVSAGSITEGSAGQITGNSLSGSSVGATSLTGNNAVANLGGFTTNNSDFSLTDDGSLNVHGPVDTGTGTLSLISNFELNIAATLTGATVDLTSTQGDLSESRRGTIVAQLLNVTANTGIYLGSAANKICKVGTDQTASGNNIIFGVGQGC
jgi:hypothetical protein